MAGTGLVVGWHPCKQSDYLGQNAAEGKGGPQVRSRFMAHGPLLLRLCGDKGLGGWGGMTNYLGAVEPSNTIKLIAFFCMPAPPAGSADL